MISIQERIADAIKNIDRVLELMRLDDEKKGITK